MFVIKRSGIKEPIDFSKVQARVSALAEDLQVDAGGLSHEIIKQMANEMPTREVDILSSSICISKQLEHPDYAVLAARLEISNWHKETPESARAVWSKISVLGPKFKKFYKRFGNEIEKMIVQERDHNFDYFSIKLIKQMYCLKSDGGLVERVQHMFARVACVVTGQYIEDDPDFERIVKTYDLLSNKMYTHGSPTLFNAGLCDKHMNLANCYLLSMADSIDSIFATMGDMAQISKCGGGLGVNLTHIRGKGSKISNGGQSDGLIPLLKMLDAKVAYINQSGRRKGALATFLEPWHPDFLDWLEIRRPGGNEDKRCRNLFCGIWMNDLFMKRVQNDEEWSFMCPYKYPELVTLYGDAFEKRYAEIEASGDVLKREPAKKIWDAILSAQIESGVPYCSYKDSINKHSNQKHLGTIKGSNLCNEIVEYTEPGKEQAVCTLASISLPAFVKDGVFEYEKLMDATSLVVKNLNSVIDLNFYPTALTKTCNFKHRPLGIGIQGFYDTCIDMGIQFNSAAATEFAGKIQAHIYYAAVSESVELAKVYGKHDTFEGSDLSRGVLHPDTWDIDLEPALDWTSLRERVCEYGTRNSLFCALMPTASTSLLLGNTESFEPIQSLCYVRKTMSGEFACVYTRLIRELIDLGLWTPELRGEILEYEGSIQQCNVPEHIKQKYVTSFDIKMKDYIDHACARSPYIDQSMSLNVFFSNPTKSVLNKMHMYAFKKGLKTSLYYLRTKPAASAMKVSVSRVSMATPQNSPASDEEESVCVSCTA